MVWFMALPDTPKKALRRQSWRYGLARVTGIASFFLHQLACCHYVARDYIAAIEAATKAVSLRPD